MLGFAIPALYTLFAWWFCTGAILFLVRRPKARHGLMLLVASFFFAAALWIISATREDVSAFGAYAGFTCSIAIWGWQEMAFLMGFITGTSHEACPAGAVGGTRFVRATQSIIYHELALFATLAALFALTWHSPNQSALWTFVVLWIMRLSAKLNLFLGVRNRSEDLLPDHLRHLETFFSKKPVNPLFPVSIALSLGAAVIGWSEVIARGASTVDSMRLNFICTMLSLAILEHLLMVVPWNPSRVWSWATRARPVFLASASMPATEPSAIELRR
jgi:putative photosynthetic complex assembly protein 2